jgi:saccharopine dehydrogenase (NAD+, L-lysine-forming)
MLRGCLEARAHYLDITGEIAVFERVMSLDGEAERRGVTLLPGVGFDVVPTDCLAAMLAARLPDASQLLLAFGGGAGLSRGTSRTMLEGLGEGGAVRRDGRIVRVPLIHDVREIPFRSGTRLAMSIPWGDVSTAYYTTGIPNITVYRMTSRRAVKRLRRIAPFLSWAPLRAVLRFLASRRRGGPPGEARAKSRMEIWGRVVNRAGREVTMSMFTPEGYDLTVLTAIAAVRRILDEPVQPGSFTPAKRFGAEFIRAIPGVEIHAAI